MYIVLSEFAPNTQISSNKKSSKVNTFLFGVSLIALVSNSGKAFAECSPVFPEEGDTVTCTGESSDWIYINQDDVDVIIEDGAKINFDYYYDNVHIVGSSSSFSNEGEIIGATDGSYYYRPLVRLYSREPEEGDDGFLANNSGIISVGDGIDRDAIELDGQFESFTNDTGGLIEGTLAVDYNFTGDVVNSGEIVSSGDAVILSTRWSLPERNTFANTETGIISGNGFRTFFDTAGTFDIVNNGSILGGESTDRVVTLSSGNHLSNGASGIIEAGGGIAVEAFRSSPSTPLTIENEGQIRSDGIAINGGGYSLNNSGTIVGELTDVGRYYNSNTVIENSGTLDGNLNFDTTSLLLENRGDINSDVNLGYNTDVFLDLGGNIAGSVDLGDGSDFWLVRNGEDASIIPGNINGGDGHDSYGVSVLEDETVTLTTQDGFEGVAIEVRNEDSIATIDAAHAQIDRTLSVIGDGTVINQAEIAVGANDGIRLYSNSTQYYFGFPYSGIVGNGSRFVNEGRIESSNLAISGLGGTRYGFYGYGDHTLENKNTIIGDISLGYGDDIVINHAAIEGVVDLNSGNNFYLSKYESSDDEAQVSDPEEIYGGYDHDSIGVFTEAVVSSSVGLTPEQQSNSFEAVAIMALGEEAHFTITGVSDNEVLPFLNVLGNGTIVNDAVVNDPVDRPDYFRFYGSPARVDVISDDLTFINNAEIFGSALLKLSGNNQHVTNNADLVNDTEDGYYYYYGSSNIVADSGVGNTFINNARISSVESSSSAFKIGGNAYSRFGEDVDDDKSQLSTFINNGEVATGAKLCRKYRDNLFRRHPK